MIFSYRDRLSSSKDAPGRTLWNTSATIFNGLYDRYLRMAYFAGHFLFISIYGERKFNKSKIGNTFYLQENTAVY